jgi:hypothetical protein
MLYRFLADAVLALHFVYVVFVLLGLVAILAGVALHWQWVRNFWFRIVHFVMIAAVAAESLLGVVCPLTQWEEHLRELGGEVGEPGSFVGRWIDRLLFVDTPPSVLAVGYCVFALAVLLTLVLAPPRRPWKN